MWDHVKTLDNKEPMYFGPMSDSYTDELVQRGLHQDRKSTKGFKWTSGKASNPASKIENVEKQGTPEKSAIDMPTWNDITSTTTFRGVRYIFSKSSENLEGEVVHSGFKVHSHDLLGVNCSVNFSVYTFANIRYTTHYSTFKSMQKFTK